MAQAATIGPPLLSPGFQARVERLSGEKISSCIQCGTCSGSCPMSVRMRYTPRRLVEMMRAGMEREVLSSGAYWYCATCYSCAVRCPRDINVTNVMGALKRMTLQRSGDRAAAFYRTFGWVTRTFGRLQEVALMGLYMVRTNPFAAFGYAPFGVKLFLRGRLNVLDVFPKRSAREVATLWRKAKELEGAS